MLPKITPHAKVKHTGDLINKHSNCILFNMNPLLMLPHWGQDFNEGPTQNDLIF